MASQSSASGKQWVLRPAAPPSLITSYPELHPYLVQVLFHRGITEQTQIDAFLNLDYGRDVHDPFLFQNMERAVDRIISAINHQEKIMVYGDYDADGVTSSVILVEALRMLGADPGIYIPYRKTEGYGLNPKAVQECNDQGINLIVTLDCGTTNRDEVALANELGMDVIIVDHHQKPPELPDAYAIVNSSFPDEPYPFRHLTSGGLAYKVATALLMRTEYGATLTAPKEIKPGVEKWWLELVAISTVTDMAPLIGENRVLVHFGMTVLRKTRRVGLQALYATMRVDPSQTDTFTIGFQIGPRLNAAGRLNHASAAYQLLITTDESEAQKFAQELHETNQSRQRLTSQMVDAAIAQIGDVGDRKILFAFDPSWEIGVVGLVAGKLTNKFHLPALVMGMSGDDVIGSGRSIPAYNIVEALQSVAGHLGKFGGHPQACGFTLRTANDREPFLRDIAAHAAQALAGIETKTPLEIDAEIELERVDWPLVEALESLEPFGIGNERPLFVARGIEIADIQTVGTDGKHLKMMVRHNGQTIHKTIGFAFGSWAQRVRIGERIDVVFEIGINEWNGRKETQLKIVDLKKSE